jgi:hypothetical protein
VVSISDNSASIVSAVARPPESSVRYSASYTYDPLNRPLRVTWSPAPAATLASAGGVSFSYGYNRVNQRTSQAATDSSWWAYPAATASVINYTSNDLNQYTAVDAAVPTACKGRSIPMAKLDTLVTTHMTERLFQPDRLALILSSLSSRRSGKAHALNSRVTALRREVTDADQKLKRLYQSVDDGITEMDDILKDRLNLLKLIAIEPKLRLSGLNRIHHRPSKSTRHCLNGPAAP